MDLITLWFGFAVLGATLAGRPFGHYLVQVVAPFALVIVTVALPRLPADLSPDPSPTRRGEPRSTAPAEESRRVVPTVEPVSPVRRGSPLLVGEGSGERSAGSRGRAAGLACLLLALLVIVPTFRGFWFSHPTLTPAYYANWAAWVAGAKTRGEYDHFHSWRAPNQEGLVRAIEADPAWVAAAPERRTLFVWGEYPWLYPLVGARNPTRYSTSYLTSFLPEAKAEVMRALEADPPLFIAQELEEWRRLPGLDAFLRARYEPVAQVDNTTVWRRRP